MNVLVIDGQGGRLGKQLIAEIIQRFPQVVVTAVGTNSAATCTMMKGGAERAATGENAVIVGCRSADIIIGPVGIAIADALLGEITPAMAAAVGQSRAVKFLMPVSKCDNIVITGQSLSMSAMVKDVLDRIFDMLAKRAGAEN